MFINMDRRDKIKTHLVKHKEAYVVGGVCLLAGIVGTLVFSNYDKNVLLTAKKGNFFAGKAKHVTLVYLEDRTNYSIPVQCLENEVVYPSMNRAETLLDLSKGSLSRYFSGKAENAGGLHFKRLDIPAENGMPLAS